MTCINLQIHENKYMFNQRLLSLREKKIKMIEDIRDLVAELQEVQSNLDPSIHKPIPAIPEMYPQEMPER